MIGKLPTVLEITQALESARTEIKGYGRDVEEVDVRLQVIPSEAMDWYLHIGDAQYDTDHRGAWGASSIEVDAAIEDLKFIAEDLLSQVEDMLGDM